MSLISFCLFWRTRLTNKSIKIQMSTFIVVPRVLSLKVKLETVSPDMKTKESSEARLKEILSYLFRSCLHSQMDEEDKGLEKYSINHASSSFIAATEFQFIFAKI